MVYEWDDEAHTYKIERYHQHIAYTSNEHKETQWWDIYSPPTSEIGETGSLNLMWESCWLFTNAKKFNVQNFDQLEC